MARPPTGSNLSITQLENLLNARRAEVQKLQQRRDQMARELAQIDSRLRGMGASSSGGGGTRMGRPSGGGGGGGGGAGGGSSNGGGGRVRNATSLVAMIEQVLGKAGKPMNVGEIAKAVQQRGYRSNSANFRGIVNQTLIKEKQFEASSRGMYQMKK